MGGRPARTPTALVGGLVCAMLLVACGTGVAALDIPPPPPTVATTTTSSLPGSPTTTPETGVPGSPTTTVAVIGPGNASINGTVFGPQGPVQGATVLVQRVVGESAVSSEAETARDGSWTVAGILGGRYRVRAWLAPSFADTSPQIVYLSDGQVLSLSLRMSQFRGPVVATSVSPVQPTVGSPMNLAVEVTTPVVGTDGVVTSPPLVGMTVELTGDPGWTVDGSGSSKTGYTGEVVFRLTCDFAGDNPMSVEVGSEPPAALQLPSCNQPPTTTTTSTTTPAPTTSTPTTSTPTTSTPTTSIPTTSTPPTTLPSITLPTAPHNSQPRSG